MPGAGPEQAPQRPVHLGCSQLGVLFRTRSWFEEESAPEQEFTQLQSQGKKKKSLNYSTSLKHFKVSLKIGERDVCQLQRDYPAVAFLVLFYDDATEYSPSGSLINVYE